MVELVKYDSDQRDKLKKNIKELLSQRGLSRKEFAEKLGYAESTINYWIRGEHMPDRFSLEAICDFFNIDDVAYVDFEEGCICLKAHDAKIPRTIQTTLGTLYNVEKALLRK